MTTKISQKYLFANFLYSNCNGVAIKSIEQNKTFWIPRKTFNFVINRQKTKIISSIVTNSEISLNKHQIIQSLISQPIHSKFYSKIQSILLEKDEKHFQRMGLQSDQSLIFNNFRINLITPQLWKKCYTLIKDTQFCQVIGRKINKKNNFKYFLIKYVFFDDPKTFLWVTYTNFGYNYSMKKLLKKFDNNNNSTEKLIIDQKYKKDRQIIERGIRWIREPSKTILGAGKIRGSTIFLFKNKDHLSFSNSFWSIKNLSLFNKKYMKKFMNKISQKNHNLNQRPYFDLKLMKQIIKKGTNSSLQDFEEEVESILRQNIQLFMKKFQNLEKEIDFFYNNSISMFDSETQCVDIKFLKQKIQSQRKNQEQLKQKKENTETNALKFQCPNNQEHFQSESEIGSEESQNEFFDDDDNQKVKTQFDANHSESEDQSFEKQSDFYKKIKMEFKQEIIQNSNFEREEKILNISFSSKNNLIDSKVKQKKEKQEYKKKKQLGNYDKKQLQEDRSTLIENSNEQFEIKNESTDNNTIQTRKIKKVIKYQSSQEQKKTFYQITFYDGSQSLQFEDKFIQKYCKDNIGILKKVQERYLIVKVPENFKQK